MIYDYRKPDLAFPFKHENCLPTAWPMFEGSLGKYREDVLMWLRRMVNGIMGDHQQNIFIAVEREIERRRMLER
jgi:hypothetical protein